MSKFFKWLTAVLAIAMMGCFAISLVACDKEGDDPKTETVKITDGIYDGSYSGGGFTQTAIFRFHETGEVIEGKQTFYFYAASGSNAFYGTPLLGVYEVLDEQITMNTRAEGRIDGAEYAEHTAEKTVVLKSLDGATVLAKTGWIEDENVLLGIPEPGVDCTLVDNTYFTTYYFFHGEDQDEKGVALEKFYANVNDVKNASITIFHNGTYEDNKVTSNTVVTGTYVKNGSSYTLTPDVSSDKGGTLVVAADGKSAEFTPTGGTKITMSDTMERTAVYTFTGSGQIDAGGGQMVDMEATLILYDDGSAVYTALGQTLNGTWNEETKVVTLPQIMEMFEEKAASAGKIVYSITIQGIEMTTEEIDSSEEVAFTFTSEAVGEGAAALIYKVELYATESGTATKAILTASLASSGTVMLTAEGTWVAGQMGPQSALFEAGSHQAITSDLEASITPNWMDMEFVMSFELGGQTITLKAPVQMSSTDVVAFTFTSEAVGEGAAALIYKVELYATESGTATKAILTASLASSGSVMLTAEGTWVAGQMGPQSALFEAGSHQAITSDIEASVTPNWTDMEFVMSFELGGQTISLTAPVAIPE